MTQLTSISQIVHVVSMLDVPRRFKSVSFQSKDVKGALNSLFLFCEMQHILVMHGCGQMMCCFALPQWSGCSCFQSSTGDGKERAHSRSNSTHIVQQLDQMRPILL